MTAPSRSTTTPPSVPSARSCSAVATTCSRAPMPAARPRRGSTAWSGTCRLNGLDPHLYLRHVLERIAMHPINRMEELLPWRVAAQLVSPRAVARRVAALTAMQVQLRIELRM